MVIVKEQPGFRFLGGEETQRGTKKTTEERRIETTSQYTHWEENLL